MSLEKIINILNKVVYTIIITITLTAATREVKADLPEIPVCIHTDDQFDADISKNSRIVIWSDWRKGKASDIDIYGCEIDPNSGFILREFPICTAPEDQQSPAVSGNGDIVVWRDRRHGYVTIYGYKISENKEFLIARSNYDYLLRPSISGRGEVVVWENGYSWGDIYASRIDTNTCEVIEEFPICERPGTQQGHSISENGDIVIWRDLRNGNADIYGYKISERKEFPICTNLSSQEHPSISGNIVVWDDCRNSDESSIFQKNIDIYGCEIDPNACKVIKEFPICTDRGNQRTPNIYRNIVVWQDSKNQVASSEGKVDRNIGGIYGYDINLGKQFEICTDPYTIKAYPKTSINIVVWFDRRGGYLTEYRNYDVYMARIPKPENIIFSLDSDLNNDSIVNLEDLAVLSEHWLEER